MKKIIILLVCLCSIRCNIFSRKGDLSILQWNEEGLYTSNNLISGVPAEKGIVVNYLKNGKHILKVKLYDPVIVAVASKTEKWGFFQFPDIYRDRNNTLVATWNMTPDVVSSYGIQEKGYAVSTNEGKSWSQWRLGIPPVGGGLILPNGNQIRKYEPQALPFDSLQLPPPVVKGTGKRHIAVYRLSQLPEELQGVYLQRLSENGTKWITEHDVLNDPEAGRYSKGNLFPVIWRGEMHLMPDESIITAFYPSFWINNNKVKRSGISFYCSTDQGRTWNVQGRIPYSPDSIDLTDNKSMNCYGFLEPASTVLSNGIFLCVMRTMLTMNPDPMYISYSKDKGRTWSAPRLFTPNGVSPQLLQLDNGVTVLASGRPGVQLRFSQAEKGEEWTEPFELLQYKNVKNAITSGYTRLLSTGKNSFLIIYDDFEYRNSENEIRKAIKVRRVEITP